MQGCYKVGELTVQGCHKLVWTKYKVVTRLVTLSQPCHQVVTSLAFLYGLAKLGMLFHVHLSVTEFWPHIYSLSPAQSSYQTSQIRPNTKMGGACNAERTTL